MKQKLTHFLPQIRCTETTRKTFDLMSKRTKRSLTSILQIVTEKVANDYIENKKINDL
jgi:hypothetical protein